MAKDRNTLLFGAALLAAGAAVAADHARHMRVVAAAPGVLVTPGDAAPATAGAPCAAAPSANAPCAAAPCAAAPCAAVPAAAPVETRPSSGSGVLLTTPPADQY
jgi:hypothetical protein